MDYGVDMWAEMCALSCSQCNTVYAEILARVKFRVLS